MLVFGGFVFPRCSPTFHFRVKLVWVYIYCGSEKHSICRPDRVKNNNISNSDVILVLGRPRGSFSYLPRSSNSTLHFLIIRKADTNSCFIRLCFSFLFTLANFTKLKNANFAALQIGKFCEMSPWMDPLFLLTSQSS